MTTEVAGRPDGYLRSTQLGEGETFVVGGMNQIGTVYCIIHTQEENPSLCLVMKSSCHSLTVGLGCLVLLCLKGDGHCGTG